MDITINTGNIADDLLNLGRNSHVDDLMPDLESIETQIPIVLESSEYELELTENPLDEFRTAVNETCLISKMPSNECISIVPGEGKKHNFCFF